MRLRYACQRCQATVATAELSLPAALACPRCGAEASFALPRGPGGTIEKCLRCSGSHLFVQKAFPRRVGLLIVGIGAVIFLILMGFERVLLGFAALLGVALIDAVIYGAAPFMTVCYHCQSEYRGAPIHPAHGAYDPKIAYYTAKKGAPDLGAGELPEAGSGDQGDRSRAPRPQAPAGPSRDEPRSPRG